jgi:hypothetical protein
MKLLKDFFDQERSRVFAPGPFFTARVMAQVDERHVLEAGIWEVVPNSTRPVFGVALMLILSFLIVELWIPRAETLLYSEADVLVGQELLEQVMALEEQQ